MIARGSLWLPMSLLLLLAGLSFWIERAVRLPSNGVTTAQLEPEGIMENFEALRTDPQGNPQYRLSAKTLRHYSGSKLTEMEAPSFVYLNPRAGEVRVRALHATVSPAGDKVDLRGTVSVVRAARPGQPEMTLRTERLLVFPERDLLRAPGQVSLSDGRLDARAGAMEYNAKLRVVKLTGRVLARFQPANR